MIASFGGRGAAAATSGGGGPTVSPVLVEMGFTTIDSYVDWLDTLTAQQCIDHVCTLIDQLTGH